MVFPVACHEKGVGNLTDRLTNQQPVTTIMLLRYQRCEHHNDDNDTARSFCCTYGCVGVALFDTQYVALVAFSLYVD